MLSSKLNILETIHEENDSVGSYKNENENENKDGAVERIKIVLLLMVKNESKIIERCLSSFINYVDGVSILDTGSIDNTVELCHNMLQKKCIKYNISQVQWKNFGVNRTISFQKCKEFCINEGFNLEKTFALAVDADMNIVINDIEKLYSRLGDGKHGHLIIQKNPCIKYFNIRFLRLDRDWKCVGATHEYWDVGSGGILEKIGDDVIFIDDKNDGGCKSDKYERDAIMLEQDLVEFPNNPRTIFYLAQTYKDLGRLDDSIQYYKKRIEIGGWHEEVWYSHYMISQLYLKIGNVNEAVKWVNLAHSYYPLRSEAIF
jgi:glycosyltransferase involved in cell wall biosynthesis